MADALVCVSFREHWWFRKGMRMRAGKAPSKVTGKAHFPLQAGSPGSPVPSYPVGWHPH